MNIIYLWFGLAGPLNVWQKMCIDRAKEIYPEANFQCITTLKEFHGMEIISAEKVLSDMHKLGLYGDLTSHMSTSDEMRFYWLMNNENTLYLDSDTYCTKKYDFTEKASKMKIEALWSGKEPKPFKDILETRIKGQLFIKLHNKVNAEDMTGYFEHKPLWAKEYRQKNYC